MFIALVVTQWVLIIGMAYWQYENEKEYRRSLINEQLDLISDRICDAYTHNTDIKAFVEFLINYYNKDTRFDKLRISVYDDDILKYNVGEPISVSNQGHPKLFSNSSNPSLEQLAEDNFYMSYKSATGRKGSVRVYTLLPFDDDVAKAVLPDQQLWLIVIILGIILTIVAYYATRYFGRNIKILKLFAQRAATDPNFIPSMDYPHDELGDICRQIIHMYNERSKAVLKLKREHKVALHAMEEKSRMKRQLTNNINHELKTPIGVIKGYLDTIIENPDMDTASREHFQLKAREHVNRLVNIITDVSAITRLEDGSQLINTEVLDYHDVVYTAANDFEESNVLGQMEFNYDVPLDCMIDGNYNLLSGMIINLTKNAVAYSKGSECGVRLLDEDDRFYRFVFYDNGVGVGEEHIPHLFDRFYRVDSGRSRKSGGTGLGLPIVYNVVEAHGGKITVRNREGGGLEFIFTLPKAKQ